MKKFASVLVVLVLVLSQIAFGESDIFNPEKLVNTYNLAVISVLTLAGTAAGDTSNTELYSAMMMVEYKGTADGLVCYENFDGSFTIAFEGKSRNDTATAVLAYADLSRSSIVEHYPLLPFMFAVAAKDSNGNGIDALEWAKNLSDKATYFGNDYIAIATRQNNDHIAISLFPN